MTKPREFWINKEFSKAIPYTELLPSVAKEHIRVREVSPELDAAIEKMVEALSKIKGCCNVCEVCASCEAMDALTAWRRATGEEQGE